MSNQGFRIKMHSHLQQMEAAAAEIERAEAAALRDAKKGRLRHISAVRRTMPDEYQAAKALEDNFWYQRLLSKRDGHMRAAQIYALAALVERPLVEGVPIGTRVPRGMMYPDGDAS